MDDVLDWWRPKRNKNSVFRTSHRATHIISKLDSYMNMKRPGFYEVIHVDPGRQPEAETDQQPQFVSTQLVPELMDDDFGGYETDEGVRYVIYGCFQQRWFLYDL